MDTWQVLLLVMIGLDILVQVLKVREAKKSTVQLQVLLAALNEPRAEEQPLAIQQLRQELIWIRATLGDPRKRK